MWKKCPPAARLFKIDLREWTCIESPSQEQALTWLPNHHTSSWCVHYPVPAKKIVNLCAMYKYCDILNNIGLSLSLSLAFFVLARYLFAFHVIFSLPLRFSIVPPLFAFDTLTIGWASITNAHKEWSLLPHTHPTTIGIRLNSMEF